MTRAQLEQLQHLCKGCSPPGGGSPCRDLYELIGERGARPDYQKLRELLEKKERSWSKLSDPGVKHEAAELALDLLKTPEDQSRYDQFLAEAEDEPPPSSNPPNRWNVADQPAPAVAVRSRGAAAVLCCVGLLPIFAGIPVAGLHRFYVGKLGTALLMLLSGGALGAWTVIDLVLILVGRFRDRDGFPLLVWYWKPAVWLSEPVRLLRWLPRPLWVPRAVLGVVGVALLLNFVPGSPVSPDDPLPSDGSRSSTEGANDDDEERARRQEAALNLNASDRRSVQTGLEYAGFPPGPVDGVFGSRTREALRGWQSQMGVVSTGFLTETDAELLQALAREVAELVVDDDRVVVEAREEATVLPGGTTSVEPVASVPAPALALAGRWIGRVEGFRRTYYVDVVFEENGARIRYPLSGCSGRLHVISGSSYREELVQGDECPVNGRVTLRRLTAERVSYEWGYDSRSVEASGQLLGVAAMAAGGDASALSGIWSGEHGYTPYPSNEYSAELTMEPTGVVLRISWPCVFRLEPVGADSDRLDYSSVLLDGFCGPWDGGRLTVRRLGRDALWFETARLEDYGTMVGILNRGFE